MTLCAAVMDQLDTTVTGTAGPAIRAGLGGGLATLQWFTAGYTLPFAVLLVVGGRLGDRHGRRRMFLAGLAGFTAASLACALAPGAGVLIAARVVQGAFGALVIPQGFGILRAVFPRERLGLAMGMFAPALGLSSVCGPVLAGALIGADAGGLGWRAVFLVNVPIGLLALVGAAVSLPRERARAAPPLDVAGVLLLGLATLLVIYPLVQGRAAGWPWWCAAMAVAGVAVFAVFVGYQRRTRRAPVIEPGLLANRAFVGGLAVAVAFFAVVGGVLFAAGVFLQLGLDLSALRAALTTAPMSAGILLSVIGSRWLRAPRRRLLQAGMAVVAAGLLGLAGITGTAGVAVTPWLLAPAFAVVGAGMGLVFGPLYAVVLAGVGEHEVGSAAGILPAAQQFGGALGVAGIATAYFALAAGGHQVAAITVLALVAAVATAGTFALVFLLPKRD